MGDSPLKALLNSPSPRPISNSSAQYKVNSLNIHVTPIHSINRDPFPDGTSPTSSDGAPVTDAHTSHPFNGTRRGNKCH